MWAKLVWSFARSLVTKSVLRKALSLAKKAAVTFASKDTMREWVVMELVKLGVKESLARIAVELAVRELKSGETS